MNLRTTISITFEGDQPIATTWGSFVKENADGFSADEFADIAANLDRNRSYVGGGGAQPVFTLAVISKPAHARMVALARMAKRTAEYLATDHGQRREQRRAAGRKGGRANA